MVNIALSDLSRVEETLMLALEQVVTARTSLTAFRDATTEAGERR